MSGAYWTARARVRMWKNLRSMYGAKLYLITVSSYCDSATVWVIIMCIVKATKLTSMDHKILFCTDATDWPVYGGPRLVILNQHVQGGTVPNAVTGGKSCPGSLTYEAGRVLCQGNTKRQTQTKEIQMVKDRNFGARGSKTYQSHSPREKKKSLARTSTPCRWTPVFCDLWLVTQKPQCRKRR